MTVRFLVQVTEHVTYETEICARDEASAIRDGARYASSFSKTFTLVERDATDWTAAPLHQMLPPETLVTTPACQTNEADGVSTRVVAPSPRTMRSDDLQQIVELLRELRETTQSRSVLSRADDFLAMLQSN